MIQLIGRQAIFPIALLAFVAVGVQYWNVVFNDVNRWVFLAILCIAVLMRGHLLLAFRTRSGFLLGAYLFWCICTTAWSEAPELSALKSVALILMVTVFAAAGQAWAFYSERNAPFGFLLPIVALSLFAGLFGSTPVVKTGTIMIYQGLTGNPNYLGAIITMSFPYAIWQAYKTRPRIGAYVISLSIITALLVLLWYSGSRTSMLCSLTIFAMFFVTLGLQKQIMAFGLIGVFLLGAVIAVPSIQVAMYQRFVVKGDLSGDGAIIATRQQPWLKSYELAQQGGIIGAGYGVSIGVSTKKQQGLTTVGYSREKGNTPLAVWEETGIVGLALYVLLILGILLELGSNIAKLKDRESKVKLGLLFGAILGFIIHSFFEAWWVAPGAPEFAYFWAIVGAAYGIVRRMSLSPQHVPSARYQMARVRPVSSLVTGHES